MPWQSAPPLMIITGAFAVTGTGLLAIDYLFKGRVRTKKRLLERSIRVALTDRMTLINVFSLFRFISMPELCCNRSGIFCAMIGHLQWKNATSMLWLTVSSWRKCKKKISRSGVRQSALYIFLPW